MTREMVGILGTINKELGYINDKFECIEKENYSNRWKFAVVVEMNKTSILVSINCHEVFLFVSSPRSLCIQSKLCCMHCLKEGLIKRYCYDIFYQ
jgi:hypothetical protein